MANTNIEVFEIKSASQITQDYRNAIISQNSSIDPNNPYTDYYFKSIAIGGICNGIMCDMYPSFINIFPQYRTGTFVDISLASYSSPVRFPATNATYTLSTLTEPINGQTFTLQVGSKLSSSISSDTYIISKTQFVSNTNSSWQNIEAINSVTGTGHILPLNTILTLQTAVVDSLNQPVTQLMVTACKDGTDQETENSASNRLLSITQIPKSGGRATDYYEYVLVDANALLSSETITDCVVLNNNQFNLSLPTPTAYPFAIFAVGGSAINDLILNGGLASFPAGGAFTPFDRGFTNSAEVITAMQNGNYPNKSLGINTPYFNVVSTQTLPLPIDVRISLREGYDQNSIIPVLTVDSQNKPIIANFSVADLVRREVRRVICSASLPLAINSIAIVNKSTASAILSIGIPISAITQRITEALGTASYAGEYATICKDAEVTYNGSISPIPLILGIPDTSSTQTLQWIYDITNYNAINVTTI